MSHSEPIADDAASASISVLGRNYPVYPPRRSDPRVHLAAVITTLHVLGQVAFGFDLSIAQIILSIATCAIFDVTVTFARFRVVAWPTSAMLTGNGIAFILRVPGTHHGDWWSLRGWWIYVLACVIALASKWLIRWRDRPLLNPSNFGLVVIFLTLGSARAEPLDFWWGRLSVSLGVAIGVITVGGLWLLRRIRLLHVALSFWVPFVAGMWILAAAGQCMTATWSLSPVCGTSFATTLTSSPEVLVFTIFMITDPRTMPRGQRAQMWYSATIAILATALIGLQQTEFASKVALLGALSIVCVLTPAFELARSATGNAPRITRFGFPSSRTAIAVIGVGLVVSLVIQDRSTASTRLDARDRDALVNRVDEAKLRASLRLPAFSSQIRTNDRIATRLDSATVHRIATDVAEDLALLTRAMIAGDDVLASRGAQEHWLALARRTIERRHDGDVNSVDDYQLKEIIISIARRPLQAAPAIMCTIVGSVTRSTYRGTEPTEVRLIPDWRHSFEVKLLDGYYRIVTDERPPGWTEP